MNEEEVTKAINDDLLYQIESLNLKIQDEILEKEQFQRRIEELQKRAEHFQILKNFYEYLYKKNNQEVTL